MYTLLYKHNNLVNAKLMIMLTDAMYAYPDAVPEYHEFRDMMSSGQLISKFWLVDQLSQLVEQNDIRTKNALVVGGWYGTLSYFLSEHFPDMVCHSMDIDERCAKFMKTAFLQRPTINPITADMFHFRYRKGAFDLIINTACEHIHDVRKWLDSLPKNQLVILQANSNPNIDDHINCPQSLAEFAEMAQLSHTDYSGEINFPMYTRYMLIGRT